MKIKLANNISLAEIPDNVKNHLEIIPVKWIDKVLEVALERKPEPLSETSVEEAVVSKQASSDVTSNPVIKH